MPTLRAPRVQCPAPCRWIEMFHERLRRSVPKCDPADAMLQFLNGICAANSQVLETELSQHSQRFQRVVECVPKCEEHVLVPLRVYFSSPHRPLRLLLLPFQREKCTCVRFGHPRRSLRFRFGPALLPPRDAHQRGEEQDEGSEPPETRTTHV